MIYGYGTKGYFLFIVAKEFWCRYWLVKYGLGVLCGKNMVGLSALMGIYRYLIFISKNNFI